MFYEVIFENGSYSVCFYNSDEEANEAIRTHHERAINGERAQSDVDRAAERIAKVLKYNEHPADWNLGQLVSKADVKGAVNSATLDEFVSVPDAVKNLRDLTDPMVESAPHESNYKMDSVGELTGWQ